MSERSYYPEQWKKAVAAIEADDAAALARCVRVSKLLASTAVEKMARKIADARGIAPAGDMFDQDDSLLMQCVANGAVKCAKFLLEDFRVVANVSQKLGDAHVSPLTAAMLARDKEMVRALLPRVNLVWERDGQGDGPLARAVKEKSLGMVEILMEAGKERGPDFGCLDLVAGVFAAIESGSPGSPGILGKVSVPIIWESHIFCEMAAMRLAASKPGSGPDGQQKMGVMAKAVMERIEDAKGLSGAIEIAKGSGDPQGRRMLDVAALGGNAPVVKHLLGMGVRVAHPGSNAPTALHWAARGGDPECVGLLAERSAVEGSTDAREASTGSTALHWAAAAGHVAAVEILLGAGADPSIRDGSGRFASDASSESSGAAPQAKVAAKLIQSRLRGVQASESQAYGDLAARASKSRRGLARMAELIAREGAKLRPPPPSPSPRCAGGPGG